MENHKKQNNMNHYKRLLKNGTVEVRCFDTNSPLWESSKTDQPVIWSGKFTEIEYLRQAMIFAMGRKWAVYTTINPISQQADNAKLKPFQRGTRDSDISRIKTIFFDFDPVQKPSTKEGRDASFVMAVNVALYLDKEGWCKPSLCDSGNGTHLLYTVDIPVTNLRGLYQYLKREYSNDMVNFDSVVLNPARITRAYGTTNQKGGRTTGVTDYFDDETPESVVMATVEKHKELVKPVIKRTWVKPPSSGGFVKDLDVVGMVGDLYLQPTNESNKHWIVCPWVNEHSFTGGTDTVIWEDEWAQFHCSHNSCSGRDISDLVAYFGESNES